MTSRFNAKIEVDAEEKSNRGRKKRCSCGRKKVIPAAGTK